MRFQPVEGADAAAPGACRAENLLHVKLKDQPSAEAARLAVLIDAGTVAGAHDLRPVMPWPANCSVQVLNGVCRGVGLQLLRQEGFGHLPGGRAGQETLRRGSLAKLSGCT